VKDPKLFPISRLGLQEEVAIEFFDRPNIVYAVYPPSEIR